MCRRVSGFFQSAWRHWRTLSLAPSPHVASAGRSDRSYGVVLRTHDDSKSIEYCGGESAEWVRVKRNVIQLGQILEQIDTKTLAFDRKRYDI